MKIISHRGLHTKAPENTLIAFESAGKHPDYFGIECDVYTTKDGIFVVHHDHNMLRMTGIDKDIMDITYEEIADAKLISNGKRKERIPSLIEFLDVCSIYQKVPIIEIKRVHDMTQLNDLLDIMSHYESLSPIIISFNINYLKYIRTMSNLPLQLLITDLSDDIIYDSKVNGIDLSINKESMTRQRVKELKEQGFKVAVFTVNNQEMFEKYNAMGIDYLTTDL